jgi:hypothetical protein
MNTVAIIGVNGSLGRSVLTALTGPIFKTKISLPILAITRDLSTVKEKIDHVSYLQANDSESYQRALGGVNAVIDLRPFPALSNTGVIEAAAKAGVTLYITSEFGVDYRLNERYRNLFTLKRDSAALARSKGLKVVEVKVGFFIDEVVDAYGSLIFFDPVNGISDAPQLNQPVISVTSVRDIGLSLASLVFRSPTELPDIVRISGDHVSPRDVISVYEKATGKKATSQPKTVTEIAAIADNAIANGQVLENYLDILRAVSVTSEAANLSTDNHNDFVNPGLFEWEKFDKHGLNSWAAHRV